MTLGGWCFLICSWAFIVSLLLFCLRGVYGKPRDRGKPNEPGR